MYTVHEPHQACVELKAPSLHWRRIAGWLSVFGVAASLALHTAGSADDVRKVWSLGESQVLIGLFSIYGPALLFLALVSVTAGFLFHYTHTLRIDQTDGMFTVVGPGALLPLLSPTKVSLSDIDVIRLEIDRTKRGKLIPLTLAFRCRDDSTEKGWMNFGIRVRGIDREEEAVHLLLRIARIAGLGHYVTKAKTARHLHVAALDNSEAERHQDVQSVPTDHVPLPLDTSAQSFVSPTDPGMGIDVSDFNPETLSKEFSETELIDCHPGRRIHIRHPDNATSEYVSLAVIGALAGGIFSAAAVSQLSAPIWRILPSVILAALFCGYAVRTRRRSEVILDWEARELKWRHGKRWRREKLSKVERVMLYGIRLHHRTGAASSGTGSITVTYEARLELHWPLHRIVLLRTEHRKRAMEAVYQLMAPLTAALAHQLDRPWEWQEV